MFRLRNLFPGAGALCLAPALVSDSPVAAIQLQVAAAAAAAGAQDTQINAFIQPTAASDGHVKCFLTRPNVDSAGVPTHEPLCTLISDGLLGVTLLGDGRSAAPEDFIRVRLCDADLGSDRHVAVKSEWLYADDVPERNPPIFYDQAVEDKLNQAYLGGESEVEVSLGPDPGRGCYDANRKYLVRFREYPRMQYKLVEGGRTVCLEWRNEVTQRDLGCARRMIMSDNIQSNPGGRNCLWVQRKDVMPMTLTVQAPTGMPPPFPPAPPHQPVVPATPGGFGVQAAPSMPPPFPPAPPQARDQPLAVPATPGRSPGPPRESTESGPGVQAVPVMPKFAPPPRDLGPPGPPGDPRNIDYYHQHGVPAGHVRAVMEKSAMSLATATATNLMPQSPPEKPPRPGAARASTAPDTIPLQPPEPIMSRSRRPGTMPPRPPVTGMQQVPGAGAAPQGTAHGTIPLHPPPPAPGMQVAVGQPQLPPLPPGMQPPAAPSPAAKFAPSPRPPLMMMSPHWIPPKCNMDLIHAARVPKSLKQYCSTCQDGEAVRFDSSLQFKLPQKFVLTPYAGQGIAFGHVAGAPDITPEMFQFMYEKTRNECGFTLWDLRRKFKAQLSLGDAAKTLQRVGDQLEQRAQNPAMGQSLQSLISKVRNSSAEQKMQQYSVKNVCVLYDVSRSTYDQNGHDPGARGGICGGGPGLTGPQAYVGGIGAEARPGPPQEPGNFNKVTKPIFLAEAEGLSLLLKALAKTNVGCASTNFYALAFDNDPHQFVGAGFEEDENFPRQIHGEFASIASRLDEHIPAGGGGTEMYPALRKMLDRLLQGGGRGIGRHSSSDRDRRKSRPRGRGPDGECSSRVAEQDG